MRIHALIIGLFLTQFVSAQNSLTLQQCIDIALERSIAVKQAALQEQDASYLQKQAQFSRLPNLNGFTNYGYNFGRRIDPFTNTFADTRVESGNAFLGSSLTLFNGFSINNSIKREKANLEAAQLNSRVAENDLMLNVCAAFLQVLTTRESVEVRKSQKDITQKQVDRTKILVDAGSVPRGDLMQLESQLASEDLELVRAENDLDLAYLNLGILLQLTPEEQANLRIQQPEIEDLSGLILESTPQDIYIKASTTLPDIRQAEKQAEVAELDMAISKSQLAPTLTLEGNIGTGYSGLQFRGVGEPTSFTPIIGLVQGSNAPVVSAQPVTQFEETELTPLNQQARDNFYQNLNLSLSIPIFNGLQRRTAYNRARLNHESALLDQKQTQDEVRNEVQQAYANARAALRSYQAAEKAVNALEEAYKYAEARLDQGVINSVSFNDTKQQLNIARIQAVQAKYDYIFRIKILDFYQGKPISL